MPKARAQMTDNLILSLATCCQCRVPALALDDARLASSCYQTGHPKPGAWSQNRRRGFFTSSGAPDFCQIGRFERRKRIGYRYEIVEQSRLDPQRLVQFVGINYPRAVCKDRSLAFNGRRDCKKSVPNLVSRRMFF